MQKCENAKNAMRCKNANAMRKSEKIRIASHHFFPFKKPKKSSIDRSFALAFASHYQPCFLHQTTRREF
jgi:hypothetical protein